MGVPLGTPLVLKKTQSAWICCLRQERGVLASLPCQSLHLEQKVSKRDSCSFFEMVEAFRPSCIAKKASEREIPKERLNGQESSQEMCLFHSVDVM